MSVVIDRLIRSKRRTLALIVERDGSVTVRAPMKTSTKAILEFVEKHAKWVKRKQAEIRSTIQESPRQYKVGEHLYYLGRAYPLKVVHDADDPLVLADSFQLDKSLQENAKDIFRNWYREQARTIIKARVAYFADKFQVTIGRVRITSAQTRWGSCSPKGDLNFSWRLVIASPEVIDYVVVHELAHILHHNHSQRFWNLVENWMPDYRIRKSQLRKYAQLIM
jgi:predicted metal-dependent hydrolase